MFDRALNMSLITLIAKLSQLLSRVDLHSKYFESQKYCAVEIIEEIVMFFKSHTAKTLRKTA